MPRAVSRPRPGPVRTDDDGEQHKALVRFAVATAAPASEKEGGEQTEIDKADEQNGFGILPGASVAQPHAGDGDGKTENHHGGSNQHAE